MPAPMPCATCHGRDGRGRPEGGVRPANLEWATLASASPSRPAYDEARLRRAITMGIDAGGRPLQPSMPRYRLWREDADDLVAWLRRLGTLRDPGIGDTTLRLHVAGALHVLFRAWADEVNARGGIYARRLEIVGGDGQDDVFALLGDPDAVQTGRAVTEEMPVLRVGTIAGETGPWVFELGPDAKEEIRALFDAAAADGAMPVAIASGPFVDLCRAPRCVRAADAASARGVLVLNPREMPPAGRLALVPSAIASDALAQARTDAYVAARILPGDVDRDAASRYALGDDRLVDQWSALAVAQIAERALVRAGRNLTREAFVDALASMHEQATGFSQPVTFDRARRHGIARVRLLRYTHGTGQLTEVR